METNSMISNNDTKSNNNNDNKDDEQLELPPGFRFHPTDEELITHYLSEKVIDNSFSAIAIGEVDLNKSEPWDLPRRAKMGEKEWYFFCVRDRKYPTGLRTNRATNAGYWKATGKDKEIYREKTLVGMKKTLVFYKGRAPKGTKTNWVMHEFRLEGNCSVYNLPKTAKNEWVICRVFQKSSGEKKPHISGFVTSTSDGNEVRQSLLPPLMDSSSPNSCERRINGDHASHVTCFSKSVDDKKEQEDIIDDNNNSFNTCSLFMAYSSPSSYSSISPASALFQKSTMHNSLFSSQIPPSFANLEYQDPILMSQQETILRMLLENQGSKLKQKSKMEMSQATGLNPDMSCMVLNPSLVDQVVPPISAAAMDLDCLWSY